MRLSREEEQMLGGKLGPGVQRAMELLVSVGEVCGAERMIKVASAHLVAPDLLLWTVGKLAEWARELSVESLEGVKSFRVPTTINPVMFDPDLLKKFGGPQSYVDEIRENITHGRNLYEKLGVIPTYTCCSFLQFPPRKGEHIATAETTVQLASNTVFGAMVNRESGSTALASALTGRTPLYGLHLPENRVGNVLVVLKKGLNPRSFNHSDYAVLGFHVGKQLAGRIPVYSGLPADMTMTNLISMAGSHGMGAIALVHVVGVTPEAPTLKAAFGGRKPAATIEVGREDIEATYQDLCCATDKKIDWVLLGCPHATLAQIKKVASLLEGKKIHSNVKLVLGTSGALLTLASQMGLVRTIEDAGGFVVPECPNEFPRWAAPPGVKIGVIAVDRPGPAMMLRAKGIPVWLGSYEQCIKAAIKGKWEAD